MYSMTGFARIQKKAVINGRDIIIDIQLKSINGKNCDISLRLPGYLMPLEISLMRFLKHICNRGTLFCNVFVSDNDNVKQYHISANILHMYNNQLKNISNELKLDYIPDIKNLVRLPGVIDSEELEREDSLYEDVLKKALEEIVLLLDDEQKREGLLLKAALKDFLESLLKSFEVIKSRISILSDLRKKKMDALFSTLSHALNTLDLIQVGRENLTAEIFKFLEKGDISEEVQRFEGHVDRFNILIDSASIEKGKHGEFLVQEMVREISTINAKSNDLEISYAVISIKMNLEKMKEQLANCV